MREITRVLMIVYLTASAFLLHAEVPADPIPTGTIYYFADDGDDNNDGLSKALPKKSLDEMKKVLKILTPGDAILFAMGDTFRFAKTFTFPVVNKVNGTASDPIIIGRYWKTGEEVETTLPVLTGVATCTPVFTHEGGNVWKTVAPSSYRMLVNGKEILGCDTKQQFDKYQQIDFYTGGGSEDLWYRSESDPNGTVWTYAGQRNIFNITFASYIIFNGIDVQWSGMESMKLSNAHHITFQNGNFAWYAFRGLYINGNSKTKGEGHLIQYNNIDTGWRLDYSFAYISSSDGVKLHNELDFLFYAQNVIVQHNTFSDFGHVAVDFYAPENDGGAFVFIGNKVIHNVFAAPNSAYSRPMEIAGQAIDSEIAYNVFKNTSARSQIGGTNTHIHHNIWKDITNSNKTHMGVTNSIVGGTGQAYDDYTVNSDPYHHIVENNIFYNFENIPLRNTSPDRNHIYRNNIFYNVGTDTRYSNVGIFFMFWGSNPDYSEINATIKNNLFYNSETTNCDVALVGSYSDEGVKAFTVSELNSFDGYNWTTNANLEDDPDFVDMIEFWITPASPAYGTGTAPLATEDFVGNAIRSPYNIGLYSQSAVNPVEIIEENSITVFPNPAEDYIIIKGENIEDCSVEIYNTLGVKVYSGTVTNGFKRIDIAALQRGFYFAKVNNRTVRLVKQ